MEFKPYARPLRQKKWPCIRSFHGHPLAENVTTLYSVLPVWQGGHSAQSLKNITFLTGPVWSLSAACNAVRSIFTTLKSSERGGSMLRLPMDLHTQKPFGHRAWLKKWLNVRCLFAYPEVGTVEPRRLHQIAFRRLPSISIYRNTACCLCHLVDGSTWRKRRPSVHAGHNLCWSSGSIWSPQVGIGAVQQCKGLSGHVSNSSWRAIPRTCDPQWHTVEVWQVCPTGKPVARWLSSYFLGCPTC